MVGVKVGSGVAVKRRVEVGGIGVFEGGGTGVLILVGGSVGVATLVGAVVLVGGWVAGGGCDGLGCGVLLGKAVVGCGVLPPDCGVMVGSGVTEAVGDGDGVLDGVRLGVGVAVWALAVSVAAMTVCTMGGSVWVGAGVGVGQATSVGAKSQYIITRALLRVAILPPFTQP